MAAFIRTSKFSVAEFYWPQEKQDPLLFAFKSRSSHCTFTYSRSIFVFRGLLQWRGSSFLRFQRRLHAMKFLAVDFCLRAIIRFQRLRKCFCNGKPIPWVINAERATAFVDGNISQSRMKCGSAFFTVRGLVVPLVCGVAENGRRFAIDHTRKVGMQHFQRQTSCDAGAPHLSIKSSFVCSRCQVTFNVLL